MNVRDKALQTLVQISQEQAFSNLQVNQSIKEHQIKKQDQNLFITLVYGTLQHLISIDFILNQFIKKGFNKFKPEAKWILRLAVFQILFLNRVPDYAIVNEAVNQIRKVSKSLSGMTNGVLRNIIRNKEKLIDEINNNKNPEIRYSLPNWIINIYKETYGNKTKEILDKINESPDLYLRVKPKNFVKVFEELKKIGAEPQVDEELGHNAIIVSKPSAFKDGISNSPLYKKGLITVQDKGAIIIGLALEPKENELILDICAAPGGKTTHIAEQLNNKGQVDAFDIHKHRVDLINANASRLKLNNINTDVQDASLFNPNLVEYYDKILVDVPCSGLGIVRRKPEIRYKQNPEDIKELIKNQKQILTNAFKYLKPGGMLLYSTCTVNPDENENVIKEVQKEFGDQFKINSQHQTSYLDNSDGFYYAIIRKN